VAGAPEAAVSGDQHKKAYVLPAEEDWKQTIVGEDVIPQMLDRFHTRGEFPSDYAINTMPPLLRDEWILRREFHDRWFETRPRAIVTPRGLTRDGKKFDSGRGLRGDVQLLLNMSGHKKTWTDNSLASGSSENFNLAVHGFYSLLRTLGFRLTKAWSFDLLNMKAIIHDWLMSPTHERRISFRSAENQLSHLRKWLCIIGKDELKLRIDELVMQVPEHLRRKSKPGSVNRTPEAAGLTGEQVVEIAMKEDRTFGMILMLELQFGLRCEEGLKFRERFLTENGIQLPGRVAGTKGARDRFIPFQTEVEEAAAQKRGKLTDSQVVAIYRDYLREIKRKPNESLGWSAGVGGFEANLKKDFERYRYLARKCGLGFISPFLSASKKFERVQRQLPLLPTENEQEPEPVKARDPKLKAAMRSVSESLGHGRVWIVHAYAGNPASPVAGKTTGEKMREKTQ
jgi:hypothetical protein